MNLSVKHPEIQISGLALTALAADVLGKGASFRFKATGYSMTPFIKDGDIVTVSPRSPQDLRTGDIAAYTRTTDERMIVHRIVATRGGLFLVKGDNSPSFDGLIPGSRILGCITRIERNGRSLRVGLCSGRKALAFLSRLRLLPLLLISARTLYRLFLSRSLAV